MACAPGEVPEPGYEKRAYWMAGYVRVRDGLAVQTPGSHALDLSYEQLAIKYPPGCDAIIKYGAIDLHGRRWWSEIDCGPLFNPYVPWDCTCHDTLYLFRRAPGPCGGPGAVAGTARPSYRLCDM